MKVFQVLENKTKITWYLLKEALNETGKSIIITKCEENFIATHCNTRMEGNIQEKWK